MLSVFSFSSASTFFLFFLVLFVGLPAFSYVWSDIRVIPVAIRTFFSLFLFHLHLHFSFFSFLFFFFFFFVLIGTFGHDECNDSAVKASDSAAYLETHPETTLRHSRILPLIPPF